MQIQNMQQNEAGLDLFTDEGKIRLEVVTGRIVHVRYTLEEHFSESPSLMVLPQQLLTQGWVVEESAETILLCTPDLRLEINRKTGAFTWKAAGSGDVLAREPDQGGKILNEIHLAEQKKYSTRLAFEFSEDEAIYGLGQHEEGVFNYRGQSELIYHHNLKIAMPVMVSTKGYAVLFDSCSLANFHDDPYGTYYWSEVEDELDFYFLYGPEPDDLVAGIRLLTGHPTMLPKWAYGYVQSKERYKSQAELVEIVEEYRRRGVGLDCIVLDWLSWPGDKWGQKTFDEERFPEPDRMMEDLHRLNARLMVSVWPKMRNEGQNQIEMRENGFLLGDGATYDPYLPEARALYWKQANDGLFSHGIDAWWCDSTEPFEPDWHGPVKPEPWQRLVTNTEVFKNLLDPERMNAYSLLHSQGMYEGQRAATEEKRVVNLTRSCYPGQVRYGTISWSGDVTAKWETLRNQIPAGLNFTMTGSPRWTFDIGGFFVGKRPEQWFWDGDYPDGCENNGYRELYARWFQMGAFLPMFRSHGTDTPREVWRFGEPGDQVYETLVKFIRLRYRLMPYIYSLAAWESFQSYTSLRALAFDFRQDSQVWNISDQFMFGPALMVCPVTEPMYYGEDGQPLEDKVRQRSVYLPQGSRWIDFWTGKSYAGGQTIQAAAPLEILPLFVRAGSILPMGPDLQYIGEKPGAPIDVSIYPGQDARFDLYDDEGDSYRYESGEAAWTPIRWDDAAQKLTIGPREGSYQGMPDQQQFNVTVIEEEPDQAKRTGTIMLSGDGQAVWQG